MKKYIAELANHIKVLFRGLCKAIYGAAFSCLMVVSFCVFVSVSKETGWSAVFDFISACATLVVSIAGVYLFGFTKKKGGKHG